MSTVDSAPTPAVRLAAGDGVSSDELIPGQFYPARARILNDFQLSANSTATVQIAGVGDLPAADLASVALNLAAKGAWFNTGSLVVYPSDASEPTATALDYNPNFYLTNMVTARVGADGKVKLANKSSQPVKVYLDVLGFTLTKTSDSLGAGSSFVPISPARLADNQTIPLLGNYELRPLGQGGVPAEGVDAVALSIVTNSPSDSGALRVYPAGDVIPVDATIDYVPNRRLQNFVIARPGTDGVINIHNLGLGATAVWVDVVGYFTGTPTSPGSGIVQPVQPARIASSLTIPAGEQISLAPRGRGGIPSTAEAVGVNVTAKSAGSGAIQVYPEGETNLDGQTTGYVANVQASGYVLTGLGTTGRVTIRNTGSAAAVVSVDVYAYTYTVASVQLNPHAAEPGDAVAIRVDNAPDSVQSMTVSSSAFADGPATLTRAAAGEPLTGTATVVSDLVPGSYAVTGTPPGLTRPVSTTLDVTGPGEINPGTGTFRVDATDVTDDGLAIGRSHDITRTALDRPDQAAFGTGWRPEFLGGMTNSALADHTDQNYVEIIPEDGTAVRYDKNTNDGTYDSADGDVLTVDSANQITAQSITGLATVWSRLGGLWLVTKLSTADTGTTTISYDAQGRTARIVSPADDGSDTPATCGTEAGSRCVALDFGYATDTTAGVDLGDYAGRLRQLDYRDAAGNAPVTIQRYRYDSAGRLRETSNDKDQRQESYDYDNNSDITTLSSTDRGTWEFSYSSVGHLTAQTKGLTAATQVDPGCHYASQFGWGDGKNTCWVSPVYHHGWRYPSWKKTPKGKWVVGINYDHCTVPSWAGGPPGKKSFWTACDMHDYLIGVHDTGWLPSRVKKSAVDSLFYNTMKAYSCSSAACRATAYAYYRAVRYAHPNW